jgi:nicotinate-nucleotide adenylyltransferase
MGKDNLTSLSKWKNFEVILQNHAIYVYPRIEAKDQQEVLSSESESSDLKSPKVHLIDLR